MLSSSYDDRMIFFLTNQQLVARLVAIVVKFWIDGALSS